MRINFLNYDGVSKCTREEMLRVLDLALETLEQKADMEVNVAFVTEDEIQNINKKQRDKDAPTDVLSFPAFDLKAGEVVDLKEDKYKWNVNPENGFFVLGDILICKNVAKKQASELKHTLKAEIVRLALHSLLHCLGYDHIEDKDYEIMHKIELEVLQKAGYKNID